MSVTKNAPLRGHVSSLDGGRKPGLAQSICDSSESMLCRASP